MTKTLITTCLLTLACLTTANAELTVGTVAHVKGQETNTLRGVGVVVGLKGTGDKIRSFEETGNSLMTMLQLSGHSKTSIKSIIGTKNAALVSVMVTVPGTGAREGMLLDCQVASLGSASSLKGGQLMLTAMTGPIPERNPLNNIVYGQASGFVTIGSDDTPTSGRITGGCRLHDDFFNPFVQDGVVTLVVDERYADWAFAFAIENAINEEVFKYSRLKAKAINQNNVVVPLPPEYSEDAVKFVSDILQLPLYDVQTVPKVVINESSYGIVIEERVTITPTTVTHGNITITIGMPDGTRPPRPERFTNIDPASRELGVQNVKLESLQQSLNEVNIPPKDMITIIKMLDAQGSIQGRVKIY
jgi:flagellar P-ring protein precursor FlgI